MSEMQQGLAGAAAYQNKRFMESWSARGLRILSEYLEPLDRLGRYKVRDTMRVFGSARITEDGPMNKYYNEAREVARMLTQWSDELDRPRGASRCARAADRASWKRPTAARTRRWHQHRLQHRLPFEQHANPYLTPELNSSSITSSMRKFWFAYLAKALIVFPGGFGTLDEMTELLTLMQTEKLEKPMMILLYGSEYWKEILNIDRAGEARNDLGA